MNAQRIEDLVTAYKILLNEDVLDSFGHVSVRSATDPDRFLMPYALPPSLVRIEDIIEYQVADSQPVDPAGRKVNGERYIHGEIYKARADVQAVIHSHSQAVIPFSVADVALRPVDCSSRLSCRLRLPTSKSATPVATSAVCKSQASLAARRSQKRSAMRRSRSCGGMAMSWSELQ